MLNPKRSRQSLQEAKKYCHSLPEKSDNHIGSWQEVTRTETMPIGTDVKRPRVQSKFKISSGKAYQIEINQIRGNTEMPLAIVRIPRLSVAERLILRLGGTISLGMLQRQGYASTEFFLRHCSKHGIILTYSQGYDGFLRCNQCTAQDHSSLAPYRTSP
jgi:hypothetical protein